jgi:hypothetical protein
MQRVLRTITSDTVTTNPAKNSHAHPATHEPGPGCFAPCGFIWRNEPKERGAATYPPCAKCMNLHLNGLLTTAHICTKES